MKNVLKLSTVIWSLGLLLCGFALVLFVSNYVKSVERREFEKKEFFNSKNLINNLQLAGGGIVKSQKVSMGLSNILPHSFVEVFSDATCISTFYEEVGGQKTAELSLGDKEGDYKFRARQKLSFEKEEAISEFTPWITYKLDISPPTGRLIVSEPSPIGNWTSLPIWIKPETQDGITVVVEDSNNSMSSPQRFSLSQEIYYEFPVKEGINRLNFFLEDEAGNKSEVLAQRSVIVDRTPPQVNISGGEGLREKIGDSLYREVVYISIEQFYGPLYGNAKAPIVGSVRGSLASLKIEGRSVKIREDGRIDTNISLYVRRGYNSYDVEAVDKAGNIGRGVITLDWDTDEANEKKEHDEELEDLQSRVDDLESQQ